MKSGRSQSVRPLILAMGGSSLVSVFLFLSRAVTADSDRYWFLLWNLCLAWVPLIFAYLLLKRLQIKPLLSWVSLVLSALLLIFLPNSFYLASDLIHIQDTGEVSVLYDAVMFLSFVWNGFLLGFTSIYVLHKILLKRLHRRDAHTVIAGVLLASSFAVYLGRYMRWNSWDIFVQPAGLLFDVSDNVINPLGHIHTFTTTFTFFILLATMYATLWQFVKYIRFKNND